MRPHEQEILRAACPDSQSWTRLEPLLAEVDRAPWFEQVDDSVFSLADWVDALLTFDTWLSEKAIAERPVETMIGYIHCCTLTMAETLSPPKLATLTREMLDRHGFDASADARAGS